MKTFRKMIAAPFLGIGFVFMGLGALIAGDHIDLIQDERPVH